MTETPTDKKVLRAFQQLTKQERQVLALRLWEGLQVPDIARRMGLRHEAVKQIQLEALTAMTETIKRLEDE